MPRKKYTEGQIALVLKELKNGAKVEDLRRKLGVSHLPEASIYPLLLIHNLLSHPFVGDRGRLLFLLLLAAEYEILRGLT